MKNARFVAFACVGLMVLMVSAWELLAVRSFIARSQRAEGTVVWLNSGGSHPQVRFMVPNGPAVTYAQNGFIWGYQEGDKVSVIYDPAKLGDACIDDAGALWGFPSLFAALGLVFVAAAWFVRK